MARQADASVSFTMPPEWHPHARCVMAFGTTRARYTKRQIANIRKEQAAIARAIAQFEPVTMLINPQDMEPARAFLDTSTEFLVLEHHDIWARDVLPSIAVANANQPVAVSWNFNVWGEKYPGYDADRDLAARFSQIQGLPLLEAGIVAEGGAYELDGAGTLMTTETCLLNSNRNPGLSRTDVETELRRLTGATNVVWLYGSDADNVTDGHIDGLARFMAPGVAVVEVSDDPFDPEFHDLLENAGRLERAKDASGNAIDVVRIMRPRWGVIGERGANFSASYVNSYFPNGGIIMPEFGDYDRDNAARKIFERLMPNRRVVQLRVDEICEGGGGIHCNVQHIPVAVDTRANSILSGARTAAK